MTSPGLASVAGLLERRHGLRFDGAGRQRLARAVGETARREGIAPETLAARLAADAVAERDLLDRVTLQESSWFRDDAAWAALEEDILPAALRRDPGLEIWSAGCAHGQETWGLAMLLDELGAPGARVVGSDVSEAALARAAAGRYDERELRGLSPERRRRHGRTVDGRWEVAPRLRGRVRFARHSLATHPPPVTASQCGVVLCRYVLIYLTPDAASGVLDRLRGTLEPDGVLLVGAAETLWHLTDAFVAEPVDRAFAYRPRPRGPGPVRAPATAAAPGVRPAARRPRYGAPGPPPETSASRAPDAALLLRRGEEALARGDNAGAVSAFRGAAFLSPRDPLTHLRLGLALEAQGDPGAERAFRAAHAARERRGGDRAGGARAEGEPAELERILRSRLGPG